MAWDIGISERVYQEIRRRLLAGTFKLRERLDVARLAKEMAASATPVREALTRLAAERLIVAKPARGFFAALWSEGELKSLYEWRLALLLLALEGRRGAGTISDTELEYAPRVTRAFVQIELSANAELRRASANADDRLHMARIVEPDAIVNALGEVEAIEAAIVAPNNRELGALLKRFHARRIVHVGEIRDRAALKALPRNGE